MTRAFKFCCGASGSKRTIPNLMKPERYKEIERLYHVARERTPEQREAFLKRVMEMKICARRWNRSLQLRVRSEASLRQAR